MYDGGDDDDGGVDDDDEGVSHVTGQARQALEARGAGHRSSPRLCCDEGDQPLAVQTHLIGAGYETACCRAWGDDSGSDGDACERGMRRARVPRKHTWAEPLNVLEVGLTAANCCI